MAGRCAPVPVSVPVGPPTLLGEYLDPALAAFALPTVSWNDEAPPNGAGLEYVPGLVIAGPSGAPGRALLVPDLQAPVTGAYRGSVRWRLVDSSGRARSEGAVTINGDGSYLVAVPSDAVPTAAESRVLVTCAAVTFEVGSGRATWRASYYLGLGPAASYTNLSPATGPGDRSRSRTYLAPEAGTPIGTDVFSCTWAGSNTPLTTGAQAIQLPGRATVTGDGPNEGRSDGPTDQFVCPAMTMSIPPLSATEIAHVLVPPATTTGAAKATPSSSAIRSKTTKKAALTTRAPSPAVAPKTTSKVTTKTVTPRRVTTRQVTTKKPAR